MEDTGHQFTTIYGHNLVGELPNFVHRPYLSEARAHVFAGEIEESLRELHKNPQSLFPAPGNLSLR